MTDQQSAQDRVIFCFGDSITYGAVDLRQQGWVNRLREHLDVQNENGATPYTITYNLGIPGDNTKNLLSRFKSELEHRYSANNDNIFVFAYGANDAAFIPSKNEFRVPIEEFVKNITETVVEAKKLSSKVILLTITPVVEEKTVDDNDHTRLNKYVTDYNLKLVDIAKEQGIDLIDVYANYMKDDHSKYLCEDGLHPNDMGHEVIFNLVKENLI